MVLPDWDRPPRIPRIQVTQSPTTPNLASPLVRLGAVIVDVGVVLTPVYVLLTSAWKREVTAAVLTGDDARVLFFATLMALTAVSLLLVYQTTAHYLFGRTLGKRVFGLYVVSTEGPARVGAHLLRAACWILSVLSLGLPFLAIFAYARRRPLHDRAGDTLVVTDEAGALAPTAGQARLVRAVYVTAALCLCGVGLSNLRDVIAKVNLERELVGEVDPHGARECEVVTQNAVEDSDDAHARVRLALTLYAAGLADRSCLESEIERETVMQTPIAPVTDLAQAFVNAEDADVSNAYLDHVCATDHDGVECAMSRLVSGWSEGKWDEVGDILASAPTGSGYLEVWGVRHYLKQARYDQALASLDHLLERPEVASFTLIERTKALYSGYRAAEARVAYRQAMVSLNADESRDLSAWACAQELAGGCQALSEVSCGIVLKDGLTSTRSASTAETLVGLRAAECRAQGPVDYQELAETVGDGDWRDFFRGALKADGRDRTAAAALFTKVLANESNADLLRIEAARRLTDIAGPRQMNDLVEAWREVESRDTWVHAGNLIFDHLVKRGETELAMSVAKSLRQDQALSPGGVRVMLGLRDGAPDAAPEVRQRAPASAGR